MLICLSWGGVARHIYFHFEFFAPSPFRTSPRCPCKWNQAWPFTCSHICFRYQLRFKTQDTINYTTQNSTITRQNTVMIRLSRHVCSQSDISGWTSLSGLLNRPLVRTWKSVPTLFSGLAEISGLSEPGLTNHHCTLHFIILELIPMYTLI